MPRIEPVLHEWDVPYRGVEGLRVHAFNTGTLTVSAGAVARGASWFRRRKLDVPAFVIEHPSGKLIVFDTGLGSDLAREPRERLGFLLSRLIEVGTQPGRDLVTQMRSAGLDPDAVEYVVLSHLHFDHTGETEHFAHAAVVTARGEKEEALSAPALMRIYHTEDWDGVGRWIEIEYADGRPYATFVAHHDLLGDGSVILVDLRGHTRGSQGMLIRAPEGPVFLTGDAAWVDESWRYAAAPLWAWNMDRWWESVWRIKKLVQLVPQTLVIAGHDLSRARASGRDDVLVHAAGEVDAATSRR